MARESSLQNFHIDGFVKEAYCDLQENIIFVKLFEAFFGSDILASLLCQMPRN